MNRTDRLLALVLELRSHEAWVRAEDLARQFGISVRTVYRDVLALNEAGVPVLSVPGQGYRLMDGYFLPPLHFTAAEAEMLAFGLDAVRHAFDAEHAEAAGSAAKKLMAALPAERRREVAALRTHIRLIEPEEGPNAALVRTLRGALLARRRVEFRYHAPGGSSQRRADPLALVRTNGVWMLAALDHDRGARRHFRLDRIEALTLAGPAGPLPEGPIGPGPEGGRRNLQVRLRFPAEAERWVRERPHYFQQAEAHTPGGYELTLGVRTLDDVLPWVLSWGRLATVLEPAGLAERVQQEARALLDRS